jgi:integral membrane protein (TIGR01906 family)
LAVVRGLATALFILAIPLALIGTNVRFLANESRVYSYAVDQYDTPVTTGISRSELLRASDELRAYFNSGAEYFNTRVEQGGKEVPLFNERETLHLKDVKSLLHWTYVTQEVALVYIIAYVVGVFVWARERPLRALAFQTLGGGLLTIAIIAVLAGFALSGFDRTFEHFHMVAFSNNLWQLDPRTDHLVQMFPEGFWFDLTMFLGLLTLAEAAVLSLGSTIHLTVTRGAAGHAFKPSQQAAH